MKILQLFLLFLITLSIGCTPPEERAENDRLLAKVHDKTLYISDMPGMFPSGINTEDSILIIDNYVRRWVRDAVLMHEAEVNVSQDLNIEKLVSDYRESLIKNNYERFLVSEMLDSIVTQKELLEYYEKNKQQFQLEASVMRSYFLKIPSNSTDKTKVKKWWESDRPQDFKMLKAWAAKNASVAFLNDSTWYKVSEVADFLPIGTLTENNVTSKKEFTQKDGESDYYFKLLEFVKRKEIPPLSYVEGQARKYILHKRQSKLLEETKEKMYNREMRDNNIQLVPYR